MNAPVRFNKNGIRILDDPKTNRMPQAQRCLPDQHRWRATGKSANDPDDSYAPTVYEHECRFCGEKDWRS